MKLIKFGILAVVATLILGAFSARATPFIGTVTNFSKLNISLVITTNVYTSHGDKEITTAKSVKLTNKQFLDLFAAWAGTTWPSGAQLVQGWDEEWDGDVLVVDKTGTNVLFDANVDSDHFFTISIFNGDGAYNETRVANNPGSEHYTWFNNGSFELFDDGVFLDFTEIYGDGPCTENFSAKWDSNSDDVTQWSDSEKLTAENAGYSSQNEMEFLGSTDYVTAHAELDSSGHGKSFPWYLY